MIADRAEREWLEILADLMAAPLTELPVEPLALQLNQTLNCVGCAFGNERPDGLLTGGIFPREERFGGHRAEIEDWGERNAWQLHPILLHYRATGRGGLIQVADVPDASVGRRLRSAWYEMARRWGCADQVALPMPGSVAERRAFVVGRDQRFSGRELDIARRVWRLLAGLDRQIQALARWRPEAAVTTDLRLTRRELAVLGLLADGLTAVAIGRRLAIRERTVHKHLEHAYTKLDVTDRLSAVLRAHHLGVLPAPYTQRSRTEIEAPPLASSRRRPRPDGGCLPRPGVPRRRSPERSRRSPPRRRSREPVDRRCGRRPGDGIVLRRSCATPVSTPGLPAAVAEAVCTETGPLTTPSSRRSMRRSLANFSWNGHPCRVLSKSACKICSRTLSCSPGRHVRSGVAA